MKKVSLFLGLLLAITIPISAMAWTATNSSPVTTYVDQNTTYQNISLAPDSRNIVIENQDSDAYVYIDFDSATNTTDTSSCYLLGPNSSVELYDYMTEGISILFEQGDYGPATGASPVCVIVTY